MLRKFFGRKKQLVYLLSVGFLMLLILSVGMLGGFLPKSSSPSQSSLGSESSSSFFSLEPSSSSSSLIPKNRTLHGPQAVVDGVSFLYDLNQKTLRYSGQASLASGCQTFGGTFLDKSNPQKIILEVKIKDSSMNNRETMCTMIYSEAPFQEEISLDLTAEQLDRFNELFEVKRLIQ